MRLKAFCLAAICVVSAVATLRAQAAPAAASPVVGVAPDFLSSPGCRGDWQYTWPFGEMGDQVPGVTELPFKGAGTMGGWGRPREYKNGKTGGTVAVWCLRDYKGFQSSQPCGGGVGVAGLSLETIAFHQLPAGLAKVENRNSCTIVLAFRMGERVFRIDSQALTWAEAEHTALRVGEAIYQFRSSRRPDDLPR